MPLRVGAPGDPTAHASAPSSSPSSSATPSSAPPSASAEDCSMASQVRRPAPDVPSKSSSSPAGKRARLQGPDLPRAHTTVDTDVDMDSADVEEHKTEVTVSRPPPTSTVPPASSAGLVAPPSSLPSPALTSSPSLPQMSDTVPVWASVNKLRAAGLDPRVMTSLVIDLDVDTRAGPAPLVLKRVYSTDPASKLSAVGTLLGDPKAGFAFKAPPLPRALLTADATTRAAWTAAQQSWYQELTSQVNASGELMWEPGSALDQRCTALSSLFQHIDPDKLKQLWPQQEFTSTWADLLLQPSAILHDRARDVQQAVRGAKAMMKVPEYTYRLRLSCPTTEVTYIVACCFANYALLPRDVPEAAKRLRAILDDTNPGRRPSSATGDTSSDPDSSDSESEWHTYRSSRQAARQHRRASSRAKQLAAFTANDLNAARFTADSAKPLLQLATRVAMRCWQHRFVECFVSNWQSVGCGDRFAYDDVAFQRVVTAVPELQDAASVRWQPRDQVGGTLVSLFVRDDLCAQLPALNTRLRQLSELPQAALKVVMEAHPRRTRGENRAFGERRRYCLTPEDTRPTHRPVQSVRPQGTSTVPSWAAVLSAARPVTQLAARRPGPATALDHRPHKEQRREPQAGPPSSSVLKPTIPPTTSSSRPASPPAPWEARMAALEARLSGLQTLCDSLRDMPRMLANIQRQLNQQIPAPPAPLPQSLSLSPSPAAAAPAASPPAPSSASSLHDGTVADLGRRIDAQESVLEKMCDRLAQLVQSMQDNARHGGVGLSTHSSSVQPSQAALPAIAVRR
jgi:hypothetical protein